MAVLVEGCKYKIQEKKNTLWEVQNLHISCDYTPLLKGP